MGKRDLRFTLELIGVKLHVLRLGAEWGKAKENEMVARLQDTSSHTLKKQTNSLD